MQVVWFKRDLRVEDHRALAAAAERGPVCCLYVYEPELLAATTWDHCHSIFIDQCLMELEENLRALGGRMCYRFGPVIDVLDDLHREYGIEGLWSHEETGDGWTYHRDLLVAQWCKAQGIPWTEYAHTGVIRRLRSRDGWNRRWDATMKQACTSPPQVQAAEVPGEGRRSPQDLGLSPSSVNSEQHGGTSAGHRVLEDFLYARGMNYQREMSAPSSAETSCSRISAHLAWGSLPLRSVFQKTVEAQRYWKNDTSPEAGSWRASLRSFQKRLHWRSHFMQKLEDEPDIEYRCIHPGYEGLREHEFNDEFFRRWQSGTTGYPMVDACMRSVAASGWLTFRMRAMVVSFAAYHLWLDWRPVAHWLARRFVDYEPGIHYSQVQMQSGVTGINTLRIYSPTKQAQDHDPDGMFIRTWIPELADIPDDFIAEPWTTPPIIQNACGCRIGSDYPEPLVDHKTAVAQARQRIGERRKDPVIREQAHAVLLRHGSRKRPERRRPRKQTQD